MQFRPALAHTVRTTLGLEKSPQVARGSFYRVRIEPLLEEHCTGCHGERRQKADLRLDSYTATLRGGRHGEVVRAGDAKGSELFARITLPPEHEKAMPPSGKAPLSADEVTVMRLWIDAGASGILPVSAIKGAPKPVAKVVIPEINEARVLKTRAPFAQAVQRWEARFPGVLAYESRGSADLQINASLLGSAFDDEALADLAPLGERLVWADLSGTGVTDTSAPMLAHWTRLRTLRLANTPVTDATARALLKLPALKVLTITGTGITNEGTAALRARGIRLYDDDHVN